MKRKENKTMKLEQLKDDQIKLETEHQICLVSENEIKIKNKTNKDLTEAEKNLINLIINERLNTYLDAEIKLREHLECAIDIRVFEAVNLVLKNISESKELCINIKNKLGIK